MSHIPAYVIRAREAYRLTLTDRVTFKDSSGAVVAGPWPCKVHDNTTRESVERVQGASRTGGETRFYLNLEYTRRVKDFWRGFVTYSETKEVVEYHVIGSRGPTTDMVRMEVEVRRER